MRLIFLLLAGIGIGANLAGIIAYILILTGLLT